MTQGPVKAWRLKSSKPFPMCQIESGRTFFPFLSLEKLMAWIMFREFLEKESETKISIKVERDKVALMLDE